VIEELENKIELQASNYVSSKINYYFRRQHFKKGNSLDEIGKNMMNLLAE